MGLHFLGACSAAFYTPQKILEFKMTKDSTAKLSIVVPTFEQSRFLSDCISRILRQDHPNFEVLVVVDGDDPESELITKNYELKDARVTKIVHSTNQGVSAAINTGILAASGEFICIVATDDPIKECYFTTLANFLMTVPNCPLVFSDGAWYMEEDQTTVLHPLNLSLDQVFWQRDDITKVMKRRRFHINANTLMYRRSSLIEHGGFNPNFHEFADWYINLRIALTDGVGYVPQNFVATRFHDDAYHLKRKRLKHSFTTIKAVFKHIGENTPLATKMAFKTTGVFPSLNPWYFFKLRFDKSTAFFFNWETFFLICGSFFWHLVVKRCVPTTLRPGLKRSLLFVFFFIQNGKAPTNA